MQNLVGLSHIMCAHIRGPKNFGYAGGMPTRDEGMVDPYKHASPPPVTVP